ncbi:MAG: ABC transporter permease, partial [Alphaproteobacteria bacterium]|nr:ABC transporter permease [Alphaproteobacteria bacterium]
MREIYLIARREYLAYVAAWGFWLSLLTAPLLLALFAVGPMLAGRAEPTRALVVIAEDVRDAEAIIASFAARSADALPRYVVAPAPATTARDIGPWLTGQKTLTVEGEQRPLFAALFVKRSGEAVSIDYWSTNLTDRSAADRAVRAVSGRMRAEALSARGLDAAETTRIEALAPTLEQYDPRGAPGAAVTDRERAPYLVGMVLSFVLWSAVMGVANMLLTGVIEEKSNKILDSLLTSASPLQILVGKLLGVAAVSFTLFSVWGLLGGGALGMASTAGVGVDLAQAALNPSLIGAFVIFFLGGYLIYGALFLALGSLCDTLQESQSLLGPVFLVLT